jgi:hypothetical protein
MAIEIQEELLGFCYRFGPQKRPANLPRRISAVNKQRRAVFEKLYTRELDFFLRTNERSYYTESGSSDLSEEEILFRLDHWARFLVEYPPAVHEMIVARQIYYFKPFTREEFFVVRQYEYLTQYRLSKVTPPPIWGVHEPAEDPEVTYQFAVRAGLAEREVGHPFVKGEMLLGSFDYEPVYGDIVYPPYPVLGDFEPFDELPKSGESFGMDERQHHSRRLSYLEWYPHTRDMYFHEEKCSFPESEIERRLNFIKAFYARYNRETYLRIRDKQYLYGLSLTRHEVYVLHQAYLFNPHRGTHYAEIWNEIENPKETPEQYYQRLARNRITVPETDHPFLPGENLFERFGREMNP